MPIENADGLPPVPASAAPPSRASAFAPGRVNLIGEHTDYNQGLALPFAIAQGITVRAWPSGDERIYAHALDLDEHDEFSLTQPPRTQGWRAFVRGAVAELARAGFPIVGSHIQIEGDLPVGAGLSSSAALEVALCLALLALCGVADFDRTDLALLCSRVENDWVGARTGLLDQLASLYGQPHAALHIDFQALTIEPVPLRLQAGWRLVVLDSAQRHEHTDSAYNERRTECARACELLGVPSLRHANWKDLPGLPQPLRRRARHVLSENARVEEAAAALRTSNLFQLGKLLNASHASLRDDYEVSSAALEGAVKVLLKAGAAGARLIGGGFGGHVLGLLPPGVTAPSAAHDVQAGPGAHLLPLRCSPAWAPPPAQRPP
ncbi:MAG TPA: galactokinase [Solirubrobacteraceae bacterium]